MTRPAPFRDRVRILSGALARRAGRPHVVRVTGESMRPTLRPGDLLLVVGGRTPRVGDLLVADLPGGRGRGIKRAVRRERDGWWVERDSPVTGTDSWLFGAVPDHDVVGVVLARLRPSPRLLRSARHDDRR